MLDSIAPFSWLCGLLADPVGWLQGPVRPGHADALNQVDRWHGVLMGLGGGILAPLAVLAARYWKVVPGQDWPRELNHRGWQRVHGLFGWTAILSLLIGAYLAFQGMSMHAHLRHPHAWAGWGVVLLLVLMVINIALRGSTGGPGHHLPRTLVHLHDVPGDHYDMTFRRRFFEFVHRLLGYGLLLVPAGTILSGYWRAGVPRWILLCTLLWWGLLLLLAWRWERQGRAVDGYQARWGPSMAHPGNRIPRLGWGMRRYTEAEYQQLPWGSRQDAGQPVSEAQTAPVESHDGRST